MANESDEELKVPPHSQMAEEAVLGAMLQSKDVLEEIVDVLTAEDFYFQQNGFLFRTMIEMLADGHPIDVVTVNDYLERRGQSERAGGLDYIGRLQSDVIVTAHSKNYAEIVRDHAISRALIRASQEVVNSVFNPQGRDVDELLRQAENAVFQIAEARDRRKAYITPLRVEVDDTLEKIRERMKSDNPYVGTETWFTRLDKMTSGLRPGNLIILGARPSMGKTSLAMNMASNICKKQGTVAIFSLEMSREELATRILSSVSKINLADLGSGQLSPEDYERLTECADEVNNYSMYLDDASCPSVREIRSRVFKLRRSAGKIDMVIIDYLQLLDADGDTRNESLSKITRQLKILAKDAGVPIVLLSQLNRSLEQRPNKRPILSDLRDSGAIEQDADLVCFVYRDEVYNSDSQDRGTAELLLSKHRNGPTGHFHLAFLKQYTLFANLAPSEQSGYDDGSYRSY